MGPLLDVLRDLGGSARLGEATDAVIDRLNIPEVEQEVTLKNGTSKVRNEVTWARYYLVKSGMIDPSRRGVWSLTEKGFNTQLDRAEAVRLFRQVHQGFRDATVENDNDPNAATDAVDAQVEETAPEDALGLIDHRNHLLTVLQDLPPVGFERICQRLLRESGFEQVIVTGKSGDGGIDGIGLLEVNPFVSFKVLFQCKRYRGSVSSPQVRDFRGAMMGRADKGLIITTGVFTLDARKEARRDGAPSIELVDGEKLLDMFERLELGLVPRVTYDVDEPFFAEYNHDPLSSN